MVLIRGNQATIYFLDPDKLRCVYQKAENGALFITKSEELSQQDPDVYLMQMQPKTMKEMTAEERAQLPAS